MNRKHFPVAILALILCLPASRAGLTFSIVPPGAINQFNGRLNAVALGQTNLVSVGTNTTVLTATLVPNSAVDLFTSNAWKTGAVPTNNFTLRGVAYGAGFFVASGTSNIVFTSANGSAWTNNSNALGPKSAVQAEGLAYTGTNFVLAPSTVDIRYANAGAVASTWSDGDNRSNAFLESYRSVAPYGSNGFALCGVSGTVRYSTNDGIQWFPSQPYNFADSNYLGIATDNARNLVCVGEGGTIKYCTNGGFTFSSQTPSPTNSSWYFASPGWQTNLVAILHQALDPAALKLNAIAYAGANNGFLAVGNYKSASVDFGFLISSTNGGADWVFQTNFLANQPGSASVIASGPQTNMYTRYTTNATALTNRSLSGAAFGIVTNTLMGNLAIIVGENGTVILGGEIPAAPTNPISQTNYAGFQSTNLSVSVPVSITADWYWLDPSSNLVLVAGGATNFAPPVIPNWIGFAAYTSNYLVFARDSRTGFVSTNSTPVSLVTRPRPTSFGLFSTNVCNGEDAVLYTSLSGIGPNWNDLVWSDGTNETATSASWSRPVFANEITNVFDNFPTNYSFTITNLFDQYTNEIAFPGGVASYTNQPGDLISTNIITVNPRPQATIVGTNTICNGQPFTFTVLLKGQAPWTVLLSDGSTLSVSSAFVTNAGPQGWAAATNVTRVPTNALDNCPVTTNYFVAAVSDSSGCTSESTDITGSAQATVNPRPHVAVLGTNTICNGQSFTFTVLLKGQAPWTVPLSDGSTLSISSAFVTNVSCTGWAAATNITRTPTNLFDNCAIVTNYSALSVTDVATGCTNEPGDISGTAQATVVPRPKATVVGTNAVCNGSPFTFTVLLSGQAPWKVQLSDNSTITVPVGFVTNGSCSGWAAATNVTRFPTNSSANAAAITNYSVLSVSNSASGCTNLPTDITGSAQATVNPRPTALLISTNQPNDLFKTNNCDDGTVFYTITNILNGFGPWTITWTSNGQSVVQFATNLANGGAGPYTNTFAVFPINTSGPNAATTNIYFISSISDTNSCQTSLPGDILGTNIVVMNPIPTLNLAVGTNDFASRRKLSSSTTRTVSVSTNGLGVFFVQTAFKNSTNTLFITNHLQLTGPSPLTNVVILQEIGADPAQLNFQTNNFTNTVTSGNAVVVISDKLFQSTPGTNFTITTLSASNLNTTCFAPFTDSIKVVVNSSNSASALVSIFGLDTNQESICGSGSQALLEADLGGSPPWTVYWNDGFTNIVPNVSALPLIRTNFYTNSTTTPFTNVFWVTNLVDLNSTNSFTSNDTGIAVIVVDPVDTNLPISFGNVTNCSDVAVPLTVGVPAGFTADWYADAGLTTLLASSTTNFVQPVPATPSTNTYFVVARFNDPNLPGACASPYTNITEVTQLCTNQISSITVLGTNAIVQWSGDYLLLQSSNLAPPYWTVVTQGGVGLNYFTNPTTPPPTNNFFVLFAPTNYPYPTNFGP